MNNCKQIKLYFGAALLLGLLFNNFQSKGISLIASKMETVSSVDEIEKIFFEPQIREIELSTALSYYNSGVLFVDARAEEYWVDGIIPGAIGNDSIDILSEKIEYLIGLDKGFVVYCSDDDCGSSEELAYQLQDIGFSNIFVFTGGWKSWTEAGYEVQKP